MVTHDAGLKGDIRDVALGTGCQLLSESGNVQTETKACAQGMDSFTQQVCMSVSCSEQISPKSVQDRKH